MLVRFSFKNFGSFHAEATLDMRAIRSYKEHEYNLIDIGEKDLYLKVAAIYGSNASGKSNFVEAYDTFFTIVRTSMNQESHVEGNDSAVISNRYMPFLLSANNDNTEFDATYISLETGYEYQYGFSYNKSRIQYEWLYRRNLKTHRQSIIFERTNSKIALGPPVKRSCEKYVDQIEDTVLALTFLGRLKLKTRVFKECIWCITDILALEWSCDGFTDRFLKSYFSKSFDDNKKSELLKFINAIDIGIKDFRVEKQKDDVEVSTMHIGLDGKEYWLPLGYESDGTRKAIALYSFVRLAIKYGRALIIDELNNQLHPLLVKYIVNLFYTESSVAQLIYTTHDTTLLDKRYFRRDQVWFINKDEFGQSQLYSLAEFKVRNDASFEKEYLGGSYGAIPILKDFSVEETSNGD